MPFIFQYGSNCDAERLNSPERLAGAAVDRGRGQTVEKYEIAFDVWSQINGCAASDVVKAPGTGRHAWGVLYGVSADRIHGKNRLDGKRTLEEIEGPRYEPKSVRVRNEAGEEVEATTFLVKRHERRTGLWTSADYVGHIITGLRAHNVPEDYVQYVIDVAMATNLGADDGRIARDQNVLIERLRTV